jgi:hypothetical protein
MRLSKDSRIQVVSEKAPKISFRKIIRQEIEECGHVLKQFIKAIQ